MRESSEGDLRIAAIVPAYNEEATLTEVLAVLKATPVIAEILVVSDGSTDRTVEIARALGLRTIHLRENQGKGRAMAIGVAVHRLVFVRALARRGERGGRRAFASLARPCSRV